MVRKTALEGLIPRYLALLVLTILRRTMQTGMLSQQAIVELALVTAALSLLEITTRRQKDDRESEHL